MARLAALLALQNVLRPVRFSVALALTPLVDRMMGALQRRFDISHNKAFGVMMFLLGASTTSAFALALTVATQMNMPTTLPVA